MCVPLAVEAAGGPAAHCFTPCYQNPLFHVTGHFCSSKLMRELCCHDPWHPSVCVECVCRIFMYIHQGRFNQYIISFIKVMGSYGAWGPKDFSFLTTE